MRRWWEEADLAGTLGADVVSAATVSGGDVSEAWRLEMQDGRSVFAKTHADPPPGLFSTEAAGLAWLGQVEALAVPEVLAVSDDAPAHLVLQWIPTGRPQAGTEEGFGRALAALHRAGSPTFGRVDGRSTGSLALPNGPSEDWVTFIADRRLRPLARLGRQRRALPEDVSSALEGLADRLGGLDVPTEPPARLHGDLWAGNRLVDDRGRSWLIDPAAHGGHREFDLAMMALFGGFGERCWAAYEEVFPLADGWRARIDLHQVVPLAVHAIKFGGGYVAATASAVARYR